MTTVLHAYNQIDKRDWLPVDTPDVGHTEKLVCKEKKSYCCGNPLVKIWVAKAKVIITH